MLYLGNKGTQWHPGHWDHHRQCYPVRCPNVAERELERPQVGKASTVRA